MNLPESVVRSVRYRLRWLRYRRQLVRVVKEVRHSAEKGNLDTRVADRLLRHLATLRDELGGSGRTS